MSVLIASATKHGATASIADRIGDRLAAAGLHVERAELSHLPKALDGFERIVLLCPVYATTWLSEGQRALRERADELRGAPTWVATIGGGPELPRGPRTAVASIAPREHAYLRGVVDETRLSFLERQTIRAAGGGFGDFRDWDAVDAFAARIVAG